MIDKEKYIKDFSAKLRELKQDAKGKWGKMNGQQMVEHLVESFRQANGRIPTKPAFTPEITKKNYDFMLTDIPFKENTPNRLLSDEPYAWKHASLHEAIAALQSEIDYFFKVYAEKPNLKIINPFFGNLNYKEQVQFLYKHTTHHARQFGLPE